MSENESTVARPADPAVSDGVGSARQSVTLETPSGTRSGRVVDASGLADAATVAAAVRSSEGDGRAGVSVACADPGPVHEHVGFVHPDLTLRGRTALAAAARSRGATTTHDEALARVRARLEDLSVPETGDAVAARRRLAGTESAVVERRERVAALRGRIQAGREAGRDVSELRSELAEAARELSEHETERAAAEEALERAERRSREARDVRERRRRLQDREANLERAARAELVAGYRDAYVTAVARVPGGPADGTAPGGPADGTTPGGPVGEGVAGVGSEIDDPFDVGPVTAALAVARVADLRCPVVLACGRFDDHGEAADWLDAAVIRV